MEHMDIEQMKAFLRANHHAVLGTMRSDGGIQLSPVLAVVRDDAMVMISSRETAMKTKNLRRRPRAFVCAVKDSFYGQWIQVEGSATVVSLPEAMAGLEEYYRLAAGEHPDWNEYRSAMIRERRVLITITPDRIGPTISG